MPDNIFLDTSIFVQENFLEGKRINEFLNLAQIGSIKLILSIITVNEIKSRFKKQARIAIEKHNELMNDREMSVLRNSLNDKGRLQKFSNLKITSQAFDTLLDKELLKAKAIIIEYPIIDSGKIFNNYFNGQFPFNKGEKKHEFPDAVALLSIEEWCSRNSADCMIFSKDKDFLKSTPAKGVSVSADYEEYLQQLLTRLHKERVDMLSTLFASSDQLIDNEIRKWISNEVDDDTIYDEFTNGYDVHDIKLPSIKVVEKAFQVISVEEETIEVEANIKVQIKIILTIDDEETGIYDSEDKVMYFRETKELGIDQELEIPIIMSFYVVNKENYEETGEITEINKNKSIQFKRDDWQFYYG